MATFTDEHLRLDVGGLERIVEQLRADGYRVIGPQVAGGAIVYDDLSTADDLPIGWTDRQEPGSYRIERRHDHARFGYAVPAASWKRYLYPPRAAVWTAEHTAAGIRFVAAPTSSERLAFIGVRACELQAIRRHDEVFLNGVAVEPTYAARRARAFLLAVNCSDPSDSCFCSSMGTGPQADAAGGFDLCFTEVLDGGEPWYLVEVGSDLGYDVVTAVGAGRASVVDMRAAERVHETAVERITRHLDTMPLHDGLLDHVDDPRWNELGERCLACANCTLVCPTCFCSTVSDSTGLDGPALGPAERVRSWDSCFTLDFSKLASGPVRPSIGARYRHWITHKLASWVDQFGQAGCVGCGRCITWCPAGIDLVAEAQRMSEDGGPQ